LKEEPPKKGMGKKIDFKKNKRNPADFMFNKLEDKIVWKDTGSLNGSDFNIRFCENSLIYVIDHIAEFKIDKCSGCEMILGPTASSVFIRNVNDSKIVVNCKQIRLRDCKNVTIMAYSQTEPIVEASSNITFIHNTYSYEGMFEHMKKSKLSVWNNKFTQIFDFSKGETPNFTVDKSKDKYKNFVYDFATLKTAA
jgi:hypothetical protein